MKSARNTFLLLLLLLLVPSMDYAQKARKPKSATQTLEGTVIETTAGPRWIGIIVESNGKKYIVSINNSDYPASDPDVVGGNVESIGTRVRIIYRKLNESYGEIWLDAVQVIKIPDKPIVSETNIRSNQTTTRRYGDSTYGYTTAEFNEQGNLIALYSDNCDPNYSCSDGLPKTGTITKIETSGNEIYSFSVKYTNGKSEIWDSLGNEFRGLWSSEQYQLISPLIRVGNRVNITSCYCSGGSGGTSALKSVVLETKSQPVTATGYIDVIEKSGSGCRIRIIAGEKIYSGVITFSRLSALTKQRINNYEDAVRILSGRQVKVTLSDISSSSGVISGIGFGNITQMTFPVSRETRQSMQTWNERTTDKETIIDLSTDILFDFDKSTIKPNAVPTLIRLARLIRQSRSGTIQLNGFTDSKGTDEYNLDLSERRAASVKQWLVSKGGVDAGRLQTKGYGENQPVAPNTKLDGSDNPAGRQ